MNCKNCKSSNEDTAIFCTECDSFLADPGRGIKASILDRLLADIITSMLVFAFIQCITYFEKYPFITGSITIFFYTVMFLFFKQASNPGKYILRLRIMDIRTGRKASILTMLLRELPGKFLSGFLTLGFGYAWALFNPNRQTLHDKIAQTVVIKESSYIKKSEHAYSA